MVATWVLLALLVAVLHVPWRGDSGQESLIEHRRINRAHHSLLQSSAVDGQRPGEGAPPGVGRVRWSTVRGKRAEAAVLLHVEHRQLTCTAELTPEAVGQLAEPGIGPRVLQELAAARAEGGVTRVQLLVHREPGEPPRAFATWAVPVTRPLVAEALRLTDDPLAGTAHLAVARAAAASRQLGLLGLPPRRLLTAEQVSALLRHLYHPTPHLTGARRRTGPGGAWPWEIDAVPTDHVVVRLDAADPGCAHATAWVKQWPTTRAGVIDPSPLLATTLAGLTTTSTVTCDLTGDDPVLAGYLTISAPAARRLAAARPEARSIREQTGLALEWCDRAHHETLAHTLPLASGLAPAPTAPAPARGQSAAVPGMAA